MIVFKPSFYISAQDNVKEGNELLIYLASAARIRALISKGSFEKILTLL